MKLLFTGATGVLGKASLPILIADGHDVSAIYRSDTDRGWLESTGARPARVDLFDASEVTDAVAGVDAVIHFATAIPPQDSMKKRRAWDANDLLRAKATSNLVEAAIAAGVGRFIQQSITFTYADGGHDWLDETAPIEPVWDILDSALTAESHVHRFRHAGGTGVNLRLSRLYGPGGASGEYITTVRKRGMPIVGKGSNYVSSIHVDDAATALAAAVTAPDGTYNVSDDVPMPAKVNLQSLVDSLGAPAPRRAPTWAARAMLGKAASLLTISHRIDNSAFRRATGWVPAFRSAAEGWADIAAQTAAD